MSELSVFLEFLTVVGGEEHHGSTRASRLGECDGETTDLLVEIGDLSVVERDHLPPIRIGHLVVDREVLSKRLCTSRDLAAVVRIDETLPERWRRCVGPMGVEEVDQREERPLAYFCQPLDEAVDHAVGGWIHAAPCEQGVIEVVEPALQPELP